MLVQVDVFGTTTIAMLVFFFGFGIVARSTVMRNYGIPEPIIGGFLFAAIVALVYAIFDIQITFDLERRDILLVYFFAALGLRFSLRELFSNGRLLLLLVGIASAYIVLQNVVGIGIARAFGYDPRIGIVAGSMALVGRSGTTVAWAPIFREMFSLEHVSRVGIGVNMAGLIAACCIGGPIARFLIQRYRLVTPGPSANLDVGFSRDVDAPKIDYRAFLLALLRIHVAIVFGQGLSWAMGAIGVLMPLYVSCLLVGIALGHVKPRLAPNLDWPGSDQCLTLIAYVSLSLFYTMTLMSLQLWSAGAYLLFIGVAIGVQVVVAVLYILFVVFPAMGRDYEAAVISSGFAGMALGSTATTMAIMTAVARQYGRAHSAFVIVPLTCGIFIDIINSLAISLFAALSG
jgi:sodium--glutamate symport carrier (gltS)